VKDKAARWSNLPNDMKERPQWAVSGASKAPMGLGPQGGLRLISVTEPSTWMSFDEACGCAWANRETVTTHVTSEGVTIRQTGLDVGYILNAADPFTCIDLDVKDAVTTPNHPEKWTTPDDFQRYVSIIEHFDSYTERSKSGKGIHVWVRGNIGRGFRRDGIEIYSQERYIISTGDVYVRKGVEDREYLLANMIHQMRPLQKVIELEELPQEADDWYVLQIAISASNSDKFGKLWKGLWREDEFNFPSQSEADLALMSMFTFYSESNAQCRRLFRESGLGKREKAQKDDRYINNTLKTIRDRQSRERNVELSGILQAADNMMALAREGIQALQGGVPPAQ
jgi:primase-polymerase (primpol)-like protein